MSNYIIDPSIFYWMKVLDTVHILSCVFFSFGVIAVIVGVSCYTVSMYDYRTYSHLRDNYELLAKNWKKVVIISGIISVICGILMIFLPNKTVILEMLIAKTITSENIQFTIKEIKEVVDYIVEAVIKITY